MHFRTLKLYGFAFWLVACAIGHERPVLAGAFPYVLQPGHATDSSVLLRVTNTHTHKTVWKRTASAGVDCFAWSPDHRSLAVIWGVQGKDHTRSFLRFTLWRVGQKPRTFTHLPEPMEHYSSRSYLYTESLVAMVWSPDQRRVLICAANCLGEASEGLGNLWCVDTQTFKAKLLKEGEIGSMKWLSPHRVFYTEIIDRRQNKAGAFLPIWHSYEVKMTSV